MLKTASCKPVKILICMLMMISVLSPSMTAAAAEESEIQPYAKVINSFTAGINISGITATCEASVAADYVTTLRVTMELQKKTSSGYENVQTWTKSGYGVYLQMSEKKTINVFSDYRLKVTVTADNESKVGYDYA